MKLSCEKITVDFVGLRALDQVSLSLKTKEILGLIGPNGSGKTTLLNTIGGQLKPTEGNIFKDIRFAFASGWGRSSKHVIISL